ncbi:MAG: hypothetical protein H6Q89_1457 [Myxococcaceae bacterium]|nr:hypothetical protein [Myxococcaceae bacterium]
MRLPRFLLLCLPILATAATAAHLNTAAAKPAGFPEGVAQQVKWLEATLDDEDAAANQHAFPEGELFTWEFYSLALFNLAEETHAPEDVERAIKVARAVLPKMDAMLTHVPFSRMKARRLRGGICWFSGQNLVRARLVALAGERATAKEVQRFHDDSALLFGEFSRSKTAVLEAHPGQSWPVDSLFGFESLQLHDRLFGTAWFRAFDTWVAAMESTKDKATGLHVSFLHLDGRVRDVPRGCALSWSLAVLPRLHPRIAAEQWAAYKKSFFGCTAGVCLVREYPPGVDRAGDVDSGPVVNGYGMSATAFALAAARANGDRETAAALERLGESFGSPVVTAAGKRYLNGTVPMFDVLSLWVRTVRMTAPP